MHSVCFKMNLIIKNLTPTLKRVKKSIIGVIKEYRMETVEH